MNTEKTIPKDQTQKHQKSTEMIKKFIWTSVGFAALAYDEGDALLQRLIEKGKLAEREGEAHLNELKTQRKQNAEKIIEERIEKILHRLDIPTKSDYQNLSKKISELSQKIETTGNNKE